MVESDKVQSGSTEQDNEASDQCLNIIQVLYKDGAIDDDQRDDLKDMVFEDDAKLFGLLARYADEEEELKKQIVAYIRSEQPDSPDPYAKNELDELSSPADAAIDVKKRKRMQKMQEAKAAEQLAKQKEAEAAAAKETNATSAFSLSECDLGASPKLNPMQSRKGRLSPIVRAKDFDPYK